MVCWPLAWCWLCFGSIRSSGSTRDRPIRAHDRQVDVRRVDPVAGHGPHRRAGRRDADEGTLVVTGDAQAQTVTLADQNRRGQQAKGDLGHLTRHQRQGVGLLEGMVGHLQAVGRRLGRDLAVDGAQLALGDVGDAPSLVYVLQVDIEGTVRLGRGHAQGHYRVTGNLGILGQRRRGVGQQMAGRLGSFGIDHGLVKGRAHLPPAVVVAGAGLEIDRVGVGARLASRLVAGQGVAGVQIPALHGSYPAAARPRSASTAPHPACSSTEPSPRGRRRRCRADRRRRSVASPPTGPAGWDRPRRWDVGRGWRVTVPP